MSNALVEKLKKSYLVFIAWKLLGSKVPPPHIVKQLAIKKYAKKFNINIFIESGTYLGDMVYAMRTNFKKIYSIELSNFYYKKALERFKRHKNIALVKGDSGKKIKQILKEVKDPAIFWLDGHYSSGKTAKGNLNTPIIQELNSIFEHKVKSHIILIDDARHFIGKNDYPKINQLRKLIRSKRSPSLNLEVKDDIIRITPNIIS